MSIIKPDKLGRRHRFGQFETPTTIHLTDRDLYILQQLHYHGPLPSNYLRAFSRVLRKGDKCATQRFRLLTDAGYLERPEWQKTYDYRAHHIVYVLTDKGKNALKERGMWSDYAPVPSGPWLHRLMTACITASIEIATLARQDIAYIPQHQILERADKPLRFEITFADPKTKEHITKALIPDAFFGLSYLQLDGKKIFRFFFVEADRNTEGLQTLSFDRKSYLRTILQYRELIGRGLYKEPFKLTAGAMVLNVTTSADHMQNLIELTADQSANRTNNYLLFQTVPNFAAPFKPPEVLAHLFTHPWNRAGAPFDISQP